MTRLPLFVCVPLLCLAQAPTDLFEKAPPPIDEALRARVSKFYQHHVDGKFRLADELVAQESKDAFFEADKSRIQGFEIVKIIYSDNFTRARVLITADSMMSLPGAKPMPVKVPTTSFWKVENGEWFWYLPPRQATETPFGKMMPGPSPDTPPGLPEGRPDAGTLLRLVSISRNEIELSADAPSSEEVVVRNGMPGRVVVTADTRAFAGLTVSPERVEIEPKAEARLMFRYEPKVKLPASFQVLVRVAPINQVFPVTVKLTSSK